MNKSALMTLAAVFLISSACGFAQSEASSSTLPSSASAPRRVQVDEDTASSLVVQKAPLSYPDAARKAGIEGTVVLKVATTYSGDVEEVTVVSGDAALAQAAAESVKHWKYKPYLQEGSPAGMETEVSITFRIKPRAKTLPAPLGQFHENAYSNDYFGIYYPLSRDWVRETQLTRGKVDSEETYVLLAAVHIPQDTDPLRADSSFTVLALADTHAPASDECRRYLEMVANDLHSRKEGQQKGDLTQFTIAGHDFYRRDFEYRHGPDHGALLCAAVKDYLLQWSIRGWSKQAIETAVATLNAITPTPPTSAPNPPQPPDALKEPSKGSQRVRVTQGVSQGLLIKKVNPIYPADARYAGIQGTVRLSAVINKNGDIIDLEVLDGPIELVVSAVNAVRKWKYRPYLLMGDPVEVQTEVQVNYTLSGR
jgi:TonB family protein